MKYFDGMKRYTTEIEEENGHYYLRYATFNLRNDIEVLEITKEDAIKLKEMFEPLDGMDIHYSAEGKAKMKEVADKTTDLIHYYRNKKKGLI